MSEGTNTEITHRNLAKHIFEILVKGPNENNKKLVEESRTDFVTRLGNHRAMDEWLEADEKRQNARASIKQDKRLNEGQYPLSGVLVLMDVDGLGKANEISHDTGDNLLRSIANATKELTERPNDVAFRRGDRSDEFLAILPGDTKDSYKALESKFNNNVSTGSASLVFGVYGEGFTAKQTLQKMDEILSAAKAGRPKGRHIETIFI
jgi:GGDEF domain-containing protein